MGLASSWMMAVTSASLQRRSVTEDEMDELHCQTPDVPVVGILPWIPSMDLCAKFPKHEEIDFDPGWRVTVMLDGHLGLPA